MTHVLAMLLAFSVQQAGQDDKAQEEAAKKRIQDFQKDLAKAKDAEARADCIDKLAEGLQHPKILDELIKWLTKGDEECRAAAENVAKYSKDKKAAEALLRAAKMHRTPDLIRKMLDEAGSCKCKGVAKDLANFFRNPDIAVCKAAVDAVGYLKTKDGIPALLDLARELEAIRDDQTNGGAPPGTGPGVPGAPSTPGPATPAADDKQKRKKEVLPAAIAALKAITGEKFETAKDWQQWWSKNSKTFKDLE